MDKLHSMLRGMRPQTKAQASSPAVDPGHVFREFIAHLDRLQRKPSPGVKTKRKPARRKRPR